MLRRAMVLSLCLLCVPFIGEAADLGFGACLTCPSNTPPPTAAGDLLLGNGTPVWTLKAAGAEGTCFRITSGLPEWTTCSTGLAGAAANGAVYATGSTTATSTPGLTNGQILVGRTGLAPVAATIQGTPSQITVTPGAGTITVSMPASVTFPGTATGAFSGSLAGNAATASAFDHNPAPCGANLFATDQAADGTLVCTQPAFSNLTGAATAGQLPATAVTSVNPDTNITGSISAQVLTLGWTGTLAKARIIASAVYNDQVNTFTGAGALTGLPAPTSTSDAATKGYVDTVAVGMSVKTSPRVATTAALTATYVNGPSNGVGATLTNNGTLAALTIDGVALGSPDRVLVKNQASTFQNGLYTVTTVGSGAVAWVLTRATDYDAPGEIAEGSYVVVTAGTVQSGTMWIMTQPGPVTVGTTPIVFTALAVAPQTITLTGAVSGIGTGTIGTTLTLVVPTLGGTGANNTATSGRYLKGDGTNFVTSSGSASGVGPCTNQFVRVLNSDALPTCASVSLGTDVTGTLLATSFPALVGDVSVGVGTLTTVLVNIPTATLMAGSLLATPITAPSIPASNKASVYVDSLSKNLAVRDDAGVVKHGVQTNTGASDNFLTAISDAGVVSRAQPSFSNISGTLLATQMPALTGGDVTSSVGTVVTSIAPGAVTLAKMANLATARLIGRTAAGTGVPEALSVVPAAVFPQLVGDVTTPGGTLNTTLANVPTGTPHAGTALFTMIATPGPPSIGKASVYVDIASKNLVVIDDSGVSKHGVQTINCSGQFIAAINDAGLPTCATPAGGGNVSNTGAPAIGQLAIWFSPTVLQGITTLPATNFPHVVGDVDIPAGSLTATLANLPTGVLMAGSLLATPITAPGIPAPNKASIYVDSLSKNIAVRDDAGVVKHGVQTNTGASDNFLTAIADDGTVSRTQPSFSNISSTLLTTQMVALTGDVTNPPGTVTTTLKTVNSTVGSFTNASITVNAKGLVTAASSGAGSSITTVGSCVSGACFTSGNPSVSLIFNNASSGTVTLQTVAGALGSAIISLPGTTGTLALTTGNVDTATALAVDPSACPTGPQQFVTDIAANGVLSCAVPVGGGGVSSGVAGTVAYYPSTAAAVDDSSGFTFDATSVLSETTHCTTVTNADVTLGAHRCVYMVTGNTNRAVNLPAAASGTNARVYEVYKIDAGTGVITLTPNGANTINGTNAVKTVGTRYEGFRVQEESATGWVAGFGLANPIFWTKYISIECIPDATTLTTGDGKCYFPIHPDFATWKVVSVSGHLGAAVSSSGAVTIDIDRCGAVATGIRCSGTNVSLFSTLLTIDANEDGTETAAIPPVINTATSDLATGQWFRVNVDGAGTGAQGLYLTLAIRNF
jgi:hypothetical protein